MENKVQKTLNLLLSASAGISFCRATVTVTAVRVTVTDAVTAWSSATGDKAARPLARGPVTLGRLRGLSRRPEIRAAGPGVPA